MAIVINPALSQAASGNVGAINYSRHRGVAVARGKYISINPMTPAQQVYQGYLTTVSQAWKSITSSQASAWNMLGRSLKVKNRLQEEYRPNGYQVFMTWNLMRTIFGEPIDTMPSAQQVILLEKFTLTSGSTGMIFAFLEPFDLTLPYWWTEYLMAGPYDSGNRFPLKKEFRLAKLMKTRDGFTITGLTSGKYYWMKARPVQRCGATSGWWEKQILVV